jgi:hypothetical protein
MVWNQQKVRIYNISPGGTITGSAIAYNLSEAQKTIGVERKVAYIPTSIKTLSDELKFYTAVDSGDPEEGGGEEVLDKVYDPRSEFVAKMQHPYRGMSGSSGGATFDMSLGCGNYMYNEPIEQNVNLITNHSNAGSEVVHTNAHIFGTSSALFGGDGGGGTGAYLLIPTGAVTGGTGGQAINENVRIQFWMKYDTIPSGDETIISRRTGTGGGGSDDAFMLYYDNSSNAIKFDVSDYSDTSSGFAHSTNIASGTGGANGITLGQWHNCTVTYKYAAGIASVCNVYWNGERKNQITSGLTGPMLTPNLPIIIGGDSGGFNPYSGYMDELHIFAGPTSANVFSGVTGATYDYYDGASAGWSGAAGLTGVSGEGSVAYDTVAFMSMDGPSGCRAFSMQSKHHVYALCSGWEPASKTLFVREVGLSGDATGGFRAYQDGGTLGAGITQGYVVGYNSDTHRVIGSVKSILTLQNKKDIKKVTFDNVATKIIDTTLRGTTNDAGASNDFLNLFGITEGSPAGSGITFGVTGGSGGASGASQPQGYSDGFSFIPNENNLTELQRYVDFINSGTTGSTGNTGGDEWLIPDADGYIHSFDTKNVLDLYSDVMGFRRATHNDLENKKITIQNETDEYNLTNQFLTSSPSMSVDSDDAGKGK